MTTQDRIKGESSKMRARISQCFVPRVQAYTQRNIAMQRQATGRCRYTPTTKSYQVHQFLGLCNFFRTHTRDFSILSGPLNNFTRKDCPWQRGELPEALKAYKELKHLLVSEPIVDYPWKDRSYSLIVDAATVNDVKDGGLGAILTQTDEQGKERVIAYASRALVNHEINYTQFLLEQLVGPWIT